MRPVSGEDLVAAALQSSLARAQKNFKLSSKKQGDLRGIVSAVQGGAGFKESVNKKSKRLRYQTEFDLWIEQANKLTFKSEGYINGASIPKDIECLNSISSVNKNKAEPSVNSVPGTKSCGNSSGTITDSGETQTGKTALKGKNKAINLKVELENSFDLLKQIKENRKEKKKLSKLRKRLLKVGYSKEETEKLILSARNSTGGVGAIFQKLREAVLQQSKEEKDDLNNSKASGRKIKMRDLENGENAPASSGPSTPPSRHPTLTSSPSASSSSAGNSGGCSAQNGGNTSNSSSSGNQHQLPQPKRILYPREKIVPGYVEKMPIGAGFYNMGNSCYLNASLQAVFHVPAFINWLRQDAEHRRHCQDNVNCIVCAMKKTLDAAMSRQNPPPSAIRPVEIINRLRSICRHFSHGRQEDAHEFLRYLFESMERSYLAAINCQRLDNRSKETNPLGQIFGGYVRTEVTCLKCHYVSTTFQPTAELQLDIRHVTTLEDAILNHFKKERLDNNDYKCEKCRTISQATKQFSLEIPPVVLCLQLKRFTLYGTKIAKRIHCNRHLDMSKYMHKSKQVNGFSNLRYRLVALVTHLGSSPNCGHYTAIAEAANGNFYQFDDNYVHQVTPANALNNDAYVIIYEMDRRTHKTPESSSSSATPTSSTYSTNNLSFPSSTVTSSSSSLYQANKAPSTPIPKLSAPQTSKLVQKSEKVVTSLVPTASTNGGTPTETSTGSSSVFRSGFERERKMISFGIKATPSPNKINILKPGAALTNTPAKFRTLSSGNGVASTSSTTSRNDSNTDRTVKLVPYNDDENDESDNENSRTTLPTSKDKRLKSPEINKVSPKRNSAELPITPPKSPKSVANTLPENDSAKKREEIATEKSTPSSSDNQVELEAKQRDGVKRKAPEDDDISPRKHQRSRQSSSSSEASSRSTSPSPERNGRNGSFKRRRSEEPSGPTEKKPSTSSQNTGTDHGSRRSKDSSSRDSFSQERERERRKDRNPSPSPRERRGSSIERKHSGSTVGSNSFDVSRFKESNAIVGWGGQKSVLSRSMDEDRKRCSEKNMDEEYNDDFDVGKIKKVRRSQSAPRETEGNRFQVIEDRKKQVELWSNLSDGHSPGFRRSSGNSGSDSKSWTNGDDSSRHRKSNLFRSDNGGMGNSRPRHSSSNNSHSNYHKNSHGRGSPYRNGHHSNGGGSSHYRSQSQNHSSYHHHSSNKHWNSDRNRY